MKGDKIKDVLITTENGSEEIRAASFSPITEPACYPKKRAKIYAACPFCQGHLQVFGEDINEYILSDCNSGIYIECHECGEAGQTIKEGATMKIVWDNISLE